MEWANLVPCLLKTVPLKREAVWGTELYWESSGFLGGGCTPVLWGCPRPVLRVGKLWLVSAELEELLGWLFPAAGVVSSAFCVFMHRDTMVMGLLVG